MAEVYFCTKHHPQPTKGMNPKMGLFEKIFGNYSDRELKKITPIVNKILALEEEYKNLSDAELKGKTEIFKKRLAEGETLDDILPEAFATIREADARVLGMRPFECQLYGGIILHQGRIAEMRTGEGKTLVATLPAYLNALTGKGVHIVTVNDYLARRDSEWMGKAHAFLGLSVGLIVHDLQPEERRAAYAADITYGTNNEMGFDYLRDNMVIYKEQKVQRGHAFAIVDEVDSILIDEARTPLIISGHGEKSDEMYNKADAFVRRLRPLKFKELDDKETYEDRDADYIVEEKDKRTFLTSKGIEKAQQYFGIENLADYENIQIQHYINQALKAYGTMHRDIDYVVKNGEVIIVDEFTGRMMYGRRYSNGLHQAIEAKEGVKIENENKTLATITFQNYFRIYGKLSGMTGTAMTEEDEFREIYGLDVIEVPTNKPMVRIDRNDRIYRTVNGKNRAVVEYIKECHAKGQPVLVGTVTIEKSELFSALLKREGIKHNVLNAKHHEKEALIVSQAGKLGAVTIATNMAGRGTDIVLGGNAEYLAKEKLAKEGFDHELIVQADGHADTDNPDIIAVRARFAELYSQFKKDVDAEAEKVKAAGGLCIIGTERHESRRIDNQLRGRAGRQGDVGESCFYISMEDDLMRLFGGERVQMIAETLNMPEDQPIDANILSRSIESAQRKVESVNFQRRKRVLEYDDVINQQRQLIYAERQRVLDGEDLKSHITKMITDYIASAVESCTGGDDPSLWNLETLRTGFMAAFLTEDDIKFEDGEKVTVKEITELVTNKALAAYALSEEVNTPERMREIERIILLRATDNYWMAHIDNMDDLRQGVSLRAYSNRDPVIEYKNEGFAMFEEMIEAIKEDTVKGVILARVVKKELKREQVAVAQTASASGEKPQPKVIPKSQKVGRNEPCPCGSGKKYKECCGKEQ